jgi:hypothetical protein
MGTSRLDKRLKALRNKRENEQLSQKQQQEEQAKEQARQDRERELIDMEKEKMRIASEENDRQKRRQELEEQHKAEDELQKQLQLKDERQKRHQEEHDELEKQKNSFNTTLNITQFKGTLFIICCVFIVYRHPLMHVQLSGPLMKPQDPSNAASKKSPPYTSFQITSRNRVSTSSTHPRTRTARYLHLPRRLIYSPSHPQAQPHHIPPPAPHTQRSTSKSAFAMCAPVKRTCGFWRGSLCPWAASAR